MRCRLLWIAGITLGLESVRSLGLIANTGSYLYHLEPPFERGFVEGFDNRYASGGVRISRQSYFIMGTFRNSFNDLCPLIGVEHNWADFTPWLSFEGTYAYAGEFFFDTFEACGQLGIYQTFKKNFGIGGVPYIFHGLEIDILPFMSIDAGFVIPGLFVATLQWKVDF